MLDGKHDGKKEAEASDDDVSGAEVEIFASKLSDGADDESLCAAKGLNIIGWPNKKGQALALFEGSCDRPVGLSKCGQGCSTHPNHEVLVGDTIKGRNRGRVSFVQILSCVIIGVVKEIT